MSNIKHKLFKIKILNDDKKDFDEKSLKVINDFLNESNNVYLNHSISTITEDVEKFGQINTLCTFVIISLIYKDLLETEYNITNTKTKTKTIVKKQILDNADVVEPITETDFDKEIFKLDSKNFIKIAVDKGIEKNN